MLEGLSQNVYWLPWFGEEMHQVEIVDEHGNVYVSRMANGKQNAINEAWAAAREKVNS